MRVWTISTAILLVSSAVTAAQDTTVVRSTGAGVWRNARLVEDLRIGVLEGDDRYIFGSVSQVGVTRNGSIFVADAQGPRVRVYGADGRFIRDVHRAGAGPGEYRGVMGLAATPDDRMALWDLPNGRINLYDANGEYQTTFRVSSGWWGSNSLIVDTAGRYWVYTNISNPACERTVTRPDGRTETIGSEAPGCLRAAYLRFTRTGAPLDTIYSPIPQTTERVPSFTVMTAEGAMQPFIPEWSSAVSPFGYYVTAHSSRYAINLHDRRPAGVRQIVRTYEPIRLNREEKNEWEARAAHYDRVLPPGAASAGVKIPDVKPALRDIMVTADGRVWVDRYVAAVRRTDVPPRTGTNLPPRIHWLEPKTFDVFEADGRFLGNVSVPKNTNIMLVRGNQAWGTTRGEFDETYIVRYRLVTN